MALAKHGVSSTTPEEILFGAGVYYKNLSYGYILTSDTALVSGKTYYTRSGSTGDYTYTEVSTPNVSNIATYYEGGWAGTVLGATSGGGKVSITPEYQDMEIDDVLVKVKGFTKKCGEAGNMEINVTEMNEGLIKAQLHLAEDESASVSGYKKLVTKSDINDSDYLDNIAFVGKRLDGKNLIVIMENALCTSAFELEGKNKTQGTYAMNFECTADPTADDLDKLPISIYVPTATI